MQRDRSWVHVYHNGGIFFRRTLPGRGCAETSAPLLAFLEAPQSTHRPYRPHFFQHPLCLVPNQFVAKGCFGFQRVEKHTTRWVASAKPPTISFASILALQTVTGVSQVATTTGSPQRQGHQRRFERWRHRVEFLFQCGGANLRRDQTRDCGEAGTIEREV